jgi:hypothetical protein
VCFNLILNSAVAFGFEIVVRILQLHLFTTHSTALHSIPLRFKFPSFKFRVQCCFICMNSPSNVNSPLMSSFSSVGGDLHCLVVGVLDWGSWPSQMPLWRPCIVNPGLTMPLPSSPTLKPFLTPISPSLLDSTVLQRQWPTPLPRLPSYETKKTNPHNS